LCHAEHHELLHQAVKCPDRITAYLYQLSGCLTHLSRLLPSLLTASAQHHLCLLLNSHTLTDLRGVAACFSSSQNASHGGGVVARGSPAAEASPAGPASASHQRSLQSRHTAHYCSGECSLCIAHFCLGTRSDHLHCTCQMINLASQSLLLDPAGNVCLQQLLWPCIHFLILEWYVLDCYFIHSLNMCLSLRSGTYSPEQLPV